MYLPSKYLKDKLIAEGCAFPTDQVFVSCEMNGTKSDGSLYDIVRNHYEDITVWEHYGDNLQSDYRKALKKGIKATLIKQNILVWRGLYWHLQCYFLFIWICLF